MIRPEGSVRRAAATALLTVLLLGATSGAVTAWSQLRNNNPSEPRNCTNVSPWYCIRWPKTSANLSVDVYVFLSSSLDRIYGVDMFGDVRKTFTRWNDVPARNPHLEETYSTGADDVFVRAGSPSACGLPDPRVLAIARTYTSQSVNRISSADICFNSEIGWNHNLDFSYRDTPEGFIQYADSRKVATHEMGHAEGLGHVSNSTSAAIIRQGTTSYYTVQNNDVIGMQEIYGAYP